MAAHGLSHQLKLQPSDLILYSAKVIPGNDTRVMQVRGWLRQGWLAGHVCSVCCCLVSMVVPWVARQAAEGQECWHQRMRDGSHGMHTAHPYTSTMHSHPTAPLRWHADDERHQPAGPRDCHGARREPAHLGPRLQVSPRGSAQHAHSLLASACRTWLPATWRPHLCQMLSPCMRCLPTRECRP